VTRPSIVIERRPWRLHVAGGLAIAIMLAASPARAQQGSPIAEQLFLEGRALMQAKQYERACEKLKAAHDLDRTATGTLLNLALCHEQVNKPATAWAEFRQVAAESAGRREDRVTLAREHEAKLFPRLSHIRIVVPPGVRVEGLWLQLDKAQRIADASWGTELPIDPGKHTLEASAPGMVPRTVTFTIGDVSDRQTVSIEPLEALPAIAMDPSDSIERDRLAALRARRIVGFALGGVGLTAVGVGIAFGLVAGNKNTEATDLCPNDRCADENAVGDARSSLSSAKTFATVSNIAVGAGALLLVSGVVVVLTSRPSAPAALRVVPSPLAGGGALFFTGEL
jgi:hypothetical protein